MRFPRFVAGMLSVGIAVSMALLGASAAHGQAYPNKPIRLLTTEAGGGNDFAARLVAFGLTSGMGQQVVVENRGGGGGYIAPEVVSKAAPDGYTLLLFSSSLWLQPLIREKSLYDPVKDFIPVSVVCTAPSTLVVHPSLPVKSVKELIALAKAKPGQLNYASGATGTTGHLGAELFKYMAGVDIMRIAYKGNGPAIIDVMAGQTQMMFATAGPVSQHIKSGKLKALAVTSAKPSPLVPGLPAIAADLPGFESISTYGIFAPAKTPPAIIKKLHEEIVKALSRQDVKDKFLASGQETVGSTPEEYAAFIKEDMTRMGKVIKAAGIREE